MIYYTILYYYHDMEHDPALSTNSAYRLHRPFAIPIRTIPVNCNLGLCENNGGKWCEHDGLSMLIIIIWYKLLFTNISNSYPYCLLAITWGYTPLIDPPSPDGPGPSPRSHNLRLQAQRWWMPTS